MKKLLCLFSLFVLALPSFAQEPVLLVDERQGLTPAQPSESELQSYRQVVRSTAAEHANAVGCDAAPELVGVAGGRFTDDQRQQQAFLLRYCRSEGVNVLWGLVVEDRERVVRHVTFPSTGVTALEALPDLNADGRQELLFNGGDTSMGITVSTVSIVSFADGEARDLGSLRTYRNKCGAYQPSAPVKEAVRLEAVPGDRPRFFVTRYGTESCESEDFSVFDERERTELERREHPYKSVQ